MPSAHVHSTLKACCAHQAASLNDMCMPALARLHLTVFALQYPMFLQPYCCSTLKLVISASCDPPEHTAMLMQAYICIFVKEMVVSVFCPQHTLKSTLLHICWCKVLHCASLVSLGGCDP